MDSQQHDPKKKRKLKFLLIAPLFILPLAAIIFWGFGGGRKGENPADEKNTKGFNTNLPEPKLKNEKWDKFKFYEQAQRDSSKRLTLRKNDPYYRDTIVPTDSGLDTGRFGQEMVRSHTVGRNSTSGKNRYEERVYQKIAMINERIQTDTAPTPERRLPSPREKSAVHDESIDRLERMMSLMQDDGQDKEMEQVNEVLDKLVAIQQPQAFRQWKQESEKQPDMVFAVNFPSDDPITLLESIRPASDTAIRWHLNNANASRPNGQFYSLEDNTGTAARQVTVPAVIYGTQIITEKCEVRLRTSQDILVNGILIESGHDLRGVASINNNRLMITIHQVVYQQHILPISLSVYTPEGVQGLPIQGNIASEVVRESTDRALQGLGVASVGSGLAGEAINSTIQTAKTLLGRKMKPVKVTIPSGYKVLLHDSRNSNY